MSRHESPDNRQINSSDLIRNSQMKGMKSMDREKDQQQQQGRNHDHVFKEKDFEDETRKRHLLGDAFDGTSAATRPKRSRIVSRPLKYNNSQETVFVPNPRRVSPPPNPSSSAVGHKGPPRRERSLPPRTPSTKRTRYTFEEDSSDDDSILTKEIVVNEPDIVAATNTDTSSLTKEEPVVGEESTNVTPSDVVKSDEISKVVSNTAANLLHRGKSETIASEDEEEENEFDEPEFLDELDEDSNDENDYRNDYPDDPQSGYKVNDEEDDDYADDEKEGAYDPEFYQLQKLIGLKIRDEDDNDSVDSDDENGHPGGNKGRLYDDDDSDEVDYLSADREEYSNYIDDDDYDKD